ncbi:SNF3 [Candida pseudojiufengensis]|uniref:SNF3 n=1 Tax=Candida pseudojiufengensis TaxID=497109 RepID=UPI002224BF7C|nr:SNF3 [Candida pseudojiufengensis]KAI5960981.1 SNF3 [Candida pseudojiufengensis]
MRQKSSSNSALIVGLVAAVGGFMYGYDTGLINDLLEMKFVYTNFPNNGIGFSTHERAIIVASLSLGTFCGALIAPLISDNYGRKFSIIISAGIIFNIGNILQISSIEIALLCVGRFVSGIAVGILSAIVPLYQAEASPKWVRGSVVFTYQWAITWGLLIASAICQGTRRMTNSGSYRIPVGVQFLWAIILTTGMLFLPESPRYYVQKNDLQKALQSLCKLRRLPADDDDLIEELVEIKANYDYELSFGKTTILDCFRSGGGRHKQGLRMLTGVGVQFFQQCSGVNFIFYYGVNFFSSTGVSNFYIMSLITYVVNVVFTIPGIILIDTVGRRPLLFWGGIGMAVSNFIIAIAGVSVKEDHVNAILCVSFSCVFILFFASTWGGCTWALCSDIYGISIRQKAVALTAATNWLVNFIFAYITPYLIDTGSHTAAMGSKIFFIWGSMNAIGTIFVYFTVYETKGLKLEEVDYMYVHCNNARISNKFKSTKIHYDQLDDNYNPLNSLPPVSTSSNDLSPNEKDQDLDLDHDLDHDNEQAQDSSNPMIQEYKDVTIVPYNNILSPSISNSSNDSNSNTNSNLTASKFRKQSIISSSINSTKSNSNQSQISNDYQLYLESLQKEYSQHYNNSANLIKKISSSQSGKKSQTIKNNHNNNNRNNSFNAQNHSLDQHNFDQNHQNSTNITVLNQNDFNQNHNINNELTNPNNNNNNLENLENLKTTIIATPFFNQPPPDSDTSSEESI